MPITVNGIELSGSNNITFGGSQATTATLNGGVVWQRAAAARVFTLADAGISFSVAQNGTVSLSIGTGTLVGTNYTNGQNIGTVSSVARRRLTGSVRVPNNPALWTNANQLITISGITAEQAATSTAVAFTLADAGISFSVAQNGIVSLSITTGTFAGTNYTNGQNIGAVSTATTRTLTGSVMVPNNPALWTNAGQTVTITGITAQQAATVPVARPFSIANAGISFSVAQNGRVSLSITTGILFGTNYTNGQNIGTVSTATTRTLTGSVRVPNDSTLWSNAGQTITITGITAQQAATPVVNGTADWSDYGDEVRSGGTATGMFRDVIGTYSPDPATQPYGMTFEQTADVMRYVQYNDYIYTETRTCELVTSPSGGGVAGRCSNPDSAIGGTDTRTRTEARPEERGTDYTATQNATGTLWSIGVVTVAGVNNNFAVASSGATSGSVTQIQNGRYVSHDWIGDDASGNYPIVTTNANRIVRVTVMAPLDATNPTATGTIDITIVQQAVTISPNGISTGSASSITETSVILSGTITMGANNSIGTTGFIYSTSQADLNSARGSTRGVWPASVQSIIRTPSSYGSYSASVTGLTDNTTYYWAAYTIDVIGHLYGSASSFMTEAAIVPLNVGSIQGPTTQQAFSTVVYSIDATGGDTTQPLQYNWTIIDSGSTGAGIVSGNNTSSVSVQAEFPGEYTLRCRVTRGTMIVNRNLTVTVTGFSANEYKENSVQVGTSDSGIPIYEFEYVQWIKDVGFSGRYRGVMFEDVPEAQVVYDNGWKHVDYSVD